MKVLRLLWYISFGVFGMLLLWVFANLPDTIFMDMSSIGGKMLSQVSKNGFFYLFAATFVVLNLIFSTIIFFLKNLPASVLFIPFKERWTATAEARKKGSYLMAEWFRGYSLLFNIALTVSMILLYEPHAEVGVPPVGWLLYVVGFAAIGWLISIFPIFKTSSVED